MEKFHDYKYFSNVIVANTQIIFWLMVEFVDLVKPINLQNNNICKLIHIVYAFIILLSYKE